MHGTGLAMMIGAVLFFGGAALLAFVVFGALRTRS
jgi:hypothetical protein